MNIIKIQKINKDYKQTTLIQNLLAKSKYKSIRSNAGQNGIFLETPYLPYVFPLIWKYGLWKNK